MNILIASDSHGNLEGVDYLVKKVAPKNDVMLFLGDGIRDWFDGGVCKSPIPFYCVGGNCDFFGCSSHAVEGYGDVKDSLILTFGNRKIFMTHGQHYGVKGGLSRLAAFAAQADADIVLYGHTHAAAEERIDKGEQILFKELQKPLYMFNPGSMKRDFFNFPTFGTLTVTENSVLFGHGKIKV